MAFNWVYKNDTRTVIQTNEYHEVRNNLDSIKDYVDCNALCNSFFSGLDSNIYNSNDISFDSIDNVSIYSVNKDLVDSTDFLSNLASKDLNIFNSENTSLDSNNFSNVDNSDDATVNLNNDTGYYTSEVISHYSYNDSVDLGSVLWDAMSNYDAGQHVSTNGVVNSFFSN